MALVWHLDFSVAVAFDNINVEFSLHKLDFSLITFREWFFLF